MEKRYLEDTAAYLVNEKRERILFELYHNALLIIKSVFLFKHFDEYVMQLKSDRNEDKGDAYWSASYYEKLIDYVKISIAFETYNKAVLLDEGYLIHRIRKNAENKKWYEQQQNGYPVKQSDFLDTTGTEVNQATGRIFLKGLTPNFDTISFSYTLKENYQKIIGLDKDLCFRLKEINSHRNRLHFYTEFKGAFEVTSHINKWRFIKEKAIETIEAKYKAIPYS